MSEAQPAPKKKKNKLVLAIVVIVVLLAGAGGGYVLLSGKGSKAKSGPPKPVLAKKPQYLPLTPAFVVNFKDEQAVRFLQVGVTLMSHDPQAIEAAKDANPVIRNALLLLFSNQDASTLTGADGKRKLQTQALAAVQKIVHGQIGRNGIEALYFTSFVMQ